MLKENRMTCPRFVVIIIIVFAFEFGNADCHLDGAIGKAPGYILNTLCLRDSHIYLRSTLTIYQKFATTSRRTTGRCAAPEFHYNCVKNRLSLYPLLFSLARHFYRGRVQYDIGVLWERSGSTKGT